MLFKNYWGSFGCWWTWTYLSLIFIKVQELQIVLRATQTLDVLIFFKKKFCLMSGLKFTLSDVTSFLPDNLSELIEIIFKPEVITWVFKSSYRKSWFEWDLNPWPLNSVQTLKPTELLGHCVYISYIYIHTYTYIHIYAYICIHACIAYIYIYIYIYMYSIYFTYIYRILLRWKNSWFCYTLLSSIVI